MVCEYITFKQSNVRNNINEAHSIPNNDVHITRKYAIEKEQTAKFHDITHTHKTERKNLFKIKYTSSTTVDSQSVMDGAHQSMKELV